MKSCTVKYLLVCSLITLEIITNVFAQQKQYTRIKPEGVIVYNNIITKSNFRNSTYQDNADFSGIVFVSVFDIK